AATPALLDDDLYDCGMQRVAAISGRGAVVHGETARDVGVRGALQLEVEHRSVVGRALDLLDRHKETTVALTHLALLLVRRVVEDVLITARDGPAENRVLAALADVDGRVVPLTSDELLKLPGERLR